jgi:hypothetical protein
MIDVEKCGIEFQCPQCGRELAQTTGKAKSETAPDVEP